MSAYALLALLWTLWTSGTSASCWTEWRFQGAADALLTGIGPLGTQAFCVYSTTPYDPRNRSSVDLDSDCPITCKTLILAMLGDCYCRHPHYTPSASSNILSAILPKVDSAVRGKTAEGLLKFLAQRSDVAKAATCRQWLMEPDQREDWACGAEEDNDRRGFIKNGKGNSNKFKLYNGDHKKN